MAAAETLTGVKETLAGLKLMGADTVSHQSEEGKTNLELPL